MPTNSTGGTGLADGHLARSIGRPVWSFIVAMRTGAAGVSDRRVRAAVWWLVARSIGVEPSGAAITASLRPDLLPRTIPPCWWRATAMSIWRGTTTW